MPDTEPPVLTVRATVAAVVLTVPVLTELFVASVGDAAVGHLVFAVSQAVGWSLLASVARAASPAPGRAARTGRVLVLVGCALQVGFAAVYGVTALDAEPLEASFVLFLLGFLAVTVGGVTWAVPLLRGGGALAGGGLLAVAVLGLLTVLVGQDPFHDVFLLTSYAAWVLAARGLQGRDVGQSLTPARYGDPV